VLEFAFNDEGNQAVGLHVRRGIAEYIPVSANCYLEADFVLKLDAETWAKRYLISIGLGKVVGS
jgi:hypothetical protein